MAEGSSLQYNAYDSCYEESDFGESSGSDSESNFGFNSELGSGSDSKTEYQSKSESDSESESESDLNVTKLGVDFDPSVQPSSPKVQDEGSKQNDVDQEETPSKKPYKGQRFISMDEVKAFYIEYARKEGFGVRVRDSKRDKARDNHITRLISCCDREGKHKKRFKRQEDPSKPIVRRNTSTQKCGCLAMFRVVEEKGGQWVVNLFHEVHNHKVVTPVKQVCIRANRYFPKIAKDLVESFRDVNLPVGKVVTLFDGNVIGFDERDFYNQLGTTKAYKTPIEGDATAMANFFLKKQAEDPQFFYAIQTDKESRAVNFLWVDGRYGIQYQYFGDVLYFDTTYKKNAYKMPFSPFTGVNHHLQSIQFGCALLLDETEETFVWAFDTWLKAMGGKAPIAMITDQDFAMGKAITRVFPHTRHRYCLWHIMKKFPDKLKLYKKKSKFKRQMQWCIRGFHGIPDFEKRWSELMVKYELTENSWLKKLYDIRERWVPVYHLETFYAGMNTTGRSEGMNSFYKKFFSHHATLREFTYKNELCLQRIVAREKKEDYCTEHKERLINGDARLLQSAAKYYTREVYLKFKRQWDARSDYTLQTSTHEEDIHTFIYNSTNEKDLRLWRVEFNIRTHDGKCECKLFENIKIPCAHLLKVLFMRDVYEIPDHFLTRRWLQEANEYRTKYNGGVVSGHQSSKLLRCTHLLKVATNLVNEGRDEDEDYTWMAQKFLELSIQFKERKEKRKEKSTSSVNSNNLGDTVVIDASQVPPIDASQDVPIGARKDVPIGATQDVPVGASQDPPNLLNPKISKTKRREKEDHTGEGNRYKGGLEKATRKRVFKHRECSLCKMKGHNSRGCSLNPKNNK